MKLRKNFLGSIEFYGFFTNFKKSKNNPCISASYPLKYPVGIED
jgi:hypothetical protein